MAARERVRIGEVARAHGVRGELSLEWHAESPELCDVIGRLVLEPPPGRREAAVRGSRPAKGQAGGRIFPIESWRVHHKRLLVKLKGIDDRDQAEAWRGGAVYALAEDMPPVGEDEVFVRDLPGLRVHLVDGRELGVIESVMAEPQEVWSIMTPQGAEVLFPAHSDFVIEMDMEAGTVVIDPPPGLLELYLEPGGAD